MTVLHGRDLFSTKWVTAILLDKFMRGYFVPVKVSIDNYFIVELNNQIYCLDSTDGVYKYREKYRRSIEFGVWFTSHYKALKPELEELKLAILKNGFPKIDLLFSEVLRQIARLEKDPKPGEGFTPFLLKDLIEFINKKENSKLSSLIPGNKNKYLAIKQNIVDYLENLDIERVVTPVKRISNFIEGELKETSPAFVGAIAFALQEVDHENKKVTNSPITSRKAWTMYGLIIGLILMVAVVIIILAGEGYFDDIMNFGEGFQGIPAPGDFSQARPPGAKDSKYYQDRYTPQELRAEIDAGRINYESLPDDIKKMVDNVEQPIAIEIKE